MATKTTLTTTSTATPAADSLPKTPSFDEHEVLDDVGELSASVEARQARVAKYAVRGKEDKISERSEPDPAIRTMREDHEKLCDGHQSVPPVMAFHLGSLGFLTPFEFENFQDQVHYVLEGHAALTLRSRLRCIIMRKADEEEPVVPGVTPSNGAKLKESNADVAAAGNGSNHHHHHHHHQHLHQHHHNTQHQHHNHGSLGKHHTHHPAKPVAPPPNNLLVLNEVVIDRGPSPYLCNIDLFLDGKQITSVQGDGTYKDVKSRMVFLRVTTSIYPVPSICSQDQIADWFESLAECLHWNMRKKQRQFDESLSDNSYPGERSSSSSSASSVSSIDGENPDDTDGVVPAADEKVENN
ncbi:unnamed protein product [Notodromas monacha]|uniref:Uncharacterized protein n=1 Tax=Notodromas monacha TaxID=399045 RepID=A0A7R9GEB8_9CRUS|nr:unnamed protein product [Notodromas monacha]CAG0917708.1 unnamed protein product [Notodromas monacha]